MLHTIPGGGGGPGTSFIANHATTIVNPGRDPRSPQTGPYSYTPPAAPVVIPPPAVNVAPTSVAVTVIVDGSVVAEAVEKSMARDNRVSRSSFDHDGRAGFAGADRAGLRGARTTRRRTATILEAADSAFGKPETRMENEKRQASAESSAARGKDAPCLRFDSQSDALNFARKCAEDGHRWTRERGFSCTNDYLNGRSRIDIAFRTLPEAHEFKLIAQVVPFVGPDLGACRPIDAKRPRPSGSAYNHSAAIERNADDLLVFVRPGERADPVEQIIPSIVRVEAANEPRQIRVDALASPLYFVIKILGRFSKRKVDTAAISATKQNRRIYERLIERMSEIIHGMRDRESHRRRQALMEAKFDDVLTGLRVRIVDDVISAALNERSAKRFELIDACFCPID